MSRSGIGTRKVDKEHFVVGLPPRTPSTSTPDYVKLDNYNHLTVAILVDNGTTVTGSAITLKQATSAAGAGEKALSFSTMWANIDIGASDTLVETAVTSDTFTTSTTNNKDLLYLIEVDADDLDLANGFNWVRAGTADATSAVLSVLYILSGARYAGVPANRATAIA